MQANQESDSKFARLRHVDHAGRYGIEFQICTHGGLPGSRPPGLPAQASTAVAVSWVMMALRTRASLLAALKAATL